MANSLLDRARVEMILAERGVTILQELGDGVALYTYNQFPGGEFPLRWDHECIARESLLYTLEFEGIDTSGLI